MVFFVSDSEMLAPAARIAGSSFKHDVFRNTQATLAF
jgi:hypothetical protein